MPAARYGPIHTGRVIQRLLWFVRDAVQVQGQEAFRGVQRVGATRGSPRAWLNLAQLGFGPRFRAARPAGRSFGEKIPLITSDAIHLHNKCHT
jgi:hypothetical protein